MTAFDEARAAEDLAWAMGEAGISYFAQRRADLQAKGLCYDCAERPPIEPGRSRCRECLRRRAAVAAVRNGARRRYRCGYCGELGHNVRSCDLRIARGEPIDRTDEEEVAHGDDG